MIRRGMKKIIRIPFAPFVRKCKKPYKKSLHLKVTDINFFFFIPECNSVHWNPILKLYIIIFHRRKRNLCAKSVQNSIQTQLHSLNIPGPIWMKTWLGCSVMYVKNGLKISTYFKYTSKNIKKKSSLSVHTVQKSNSTQFHWKHILPQFIHHVNIGVLFVIKHSIVQ